MPNKRTTTLFLIAVYSATLAFIQLRHVIFNPDIFANDQTMHVYWTAIFKNPNLFLNDYLTEYAMHCTPLGYTALYWLASRFMDPINFSNLAPICISAITAILFYLYFEKISGNRIALIAVAFVVVDATIFNRMYGSTPRMFAWPFIALMLFSISSKKYYCLAISFLGMALFYPIVFILCVCAYMLAKIIEAWHQKTLVDTRIWIVIICIALGSAVILTQQLFIQKQGYGPALGHSDIQKDKFFHTKYGFGRDYRVPKSNFINQTAAKTWYYTFLNQKIINNISNKKTANQIRKILKPSIFFINLFLAIGVLLICIKKKKKIPYELYALAMSGFCLYMIAQQTGWKLYHPPRYIDYSFAPLNIWIFSLWADRLLGSIRNISLQKKTRLLFILFIILVLVPRYDAIITNNPRNLDAFKFIQSLPEDSFIAAYPTKIGDAIPLLVQRKIYISDSLSHPYHKEYFKEVKKRNRRLIRAIYSRDKNHLIQFMKHNKIDYMMVDLHCFKDFHKNIKYYDKTVWDQLNSEKSNKERPIQLIPITKLLFKSNDIVVFNQKAFEDV